MKIIVKTNWRIMHRPLIICSMIPFSITLVFTISCQVSQRPEIQANRYSLPLFSLTISFLLILFFYFILTSYRITFDGEKLTYHKFYIPVKSFSIPEIESVGYSPQIHYLFINWEYAWSCRLFQEKDIDALLEILSQRHGIETGKS